MNYFAHGVRFLDDPYRMAGTAVPDWLSVADRRLRLRPHRIGPLVGDAEPVAAAVAQGIRHHLEDDARFHRTRAFVELSLALTVSARDALDEPMGLRPAFVGHFLVEVLLDAALIAENIPRAERYYRALEEVDADRVQQAVNRMVAQPTDRLAETIRRFCRERILWDYLEDVTLLKRLNQVLRRVRLAELPERFLARLPSARRLVASRRQELFDEVCRVERIGRDGKPFGPTFAD